jgi:hypothetical protein
MESVMKKITILLIITLFAYTAFASEKAGVITKFEGKVQLFDGVSPRAKNIDTPGTEVFVKNKIATKRNAKAIVDLISGDKIALDESATMTIHEIEKFQAWGGKVIFKIKKRARASGLQVVTKTAVIGVKGTEFLVDADKEGEKYDIYLKEGKVECTPVEGQFKMYKDVVMDEYEAYVRKMTGEYDEYVKQLEEEFVEFVDGFVMEPGQAFSIDGQDVRKLEFTDEINKAFGILDVE